MSQPEKRGVLKRRLRPQVLTAFEEDTAPFGEQEREAYEDGISTFIKAVDTLEGQFSEEDSESRE